MAEKFLMELRAMKKNAVQQRCRVMRCSGRQSMLKSRQGKKLAASVVAKTSNPI